MDAATKIANLKKWFFRMLQGDNNPYYMLSKPHGNSYRQITNGGPGLQVDTLWETLESAIWQEYNNGVRKFLVVARKGGPKGSSFESELDLGFSMSNQTTNTINGMPGQQPATDVNAIIKGVEDRLNANWEKKFMELHHEQELKEKEEIIASLQADQRTPVEKAADSLAAIMAVMGQLDISAIAGLVQSIKGNMQPQPGGIHGNIIKEQPAAPGETVPKQVQPNNGDAGDSEPNEQDYIEAGEAIEMMLDAGWETPGQVLLKVAQFASTKKAEAENLLKMIAQ